MNQPTRFTRPERVLLILAQDHGGCRGLAIRFSDESRFRFESIAELSAWLLGPAARSAAPGDEGRGPRECGPGSGAADEVAALPPEGGDSP